MVVQGRDLDDLLALPASRQHRARLPVVDIDGLFIKVFVVLPAEVASLLVELLAVVCTLCLSRSRSLPIHVHIGLLLVLLLRHFLGSCSILAIVSLRRSMARHASTLLDSTSG